MSIRSLNKAQLSGRSLLSQMAAGGGNSDEDEMMLKEILGELGGSTAGLGIK